MKNLIKKPVTFETESASDVLHLPDGKEVLGYDEALAQLEVWVGVSSYRYLNDHSGYKKL